jgi:hypothetical protein
MSSMKKIAGFVASLIVLSFGLFLFFNNFSDEDSPPSKPPTSPAEAAQGIDDSEPSGPATDDNLPLTLDQFDQLPQEQQDRMLEEFVLDFWEKELGPSGETRAEEESLSLEIFNRPYMQTLTERELFQLLPEDREKDIDEVMENCSQVRSYVNGVIAEAESCMADKDYLSAEAYFVHSLEIGRELSANKTGLIITRLAGMASEKLGLNGLVKLYTETGDDSKVQMAREQLSEIESEVEEIRNTARQSEANR